MECVGVELAGTRVGVDVPTVATVVLVIVIAGIGADLVAVAAEEGIGVKNEAMVRGAVDEEVGVAEFTGALVGVV
jgi:hypothetical protein